MLLNDRGGRWSSIEQRDQVEYMRIVYYGEKQGEDKDMENFQIVVRLCGVSAVNQNRLMLHS